MQSRLGNFGLYLECDKERQEFVRWSHHSLRVVLGGDGDHRDIWFGGADLVGRAPISDSMPTNLFVVRVWMSHVSPSKDSAMAFRNRLGQVRVVHRAYSIISIKIVMVKTDRKDSKPMAFEASL